MVSLIHFFFSVCIEKKRFIMGRKSLTKTLKSVKKTVGTGVKIATKKGVKLGKQAAITGGKLALKEGVKYGNTALNTSLRGAGAAASATAGNPMPYIGTELFIKGKDHLVKKGVDHLTKGKKKKKTSTKKGGGYSSSLSAHNSYPLLPVKKVAPRSKAGLGISVASHARKALSNASVSATRSAAYRNRDHPSSAPRPTGAKM